MSHNRELKYVDPLRNPRFSSTQVRDRRGWTLLISSFFVPGSVQTMLGNHKLGRWGLRSVLITWTLLVVLLCLFVVSRSFLITLLTSPWILIPLTVWVMVQGATWLWCFLDTIRLVRIVSLAPKTRPVFLAAALACALLVSGGYVYGFTTLNSGRQLLSNIFSSGKAAKPVDGRYNIALLGSDAGKGRTGIRPDSLSVVSIDAQTGKTVVIGIPRNTQNVPFPKSSPLHAQYPNGYNCGDECLINAVYKLGEDNADLYDDSAPAGAQATKEALQGVTGLEIQYYAMIDLVGFQELIDAMGGITLTSHVRVPISSKVNASGQHDPPKGWIEPGENIKLDGYHALWYARAREFSSDYERMIRQRCVQEAMLKQMDSATVLLRFQDISKAAPNVVSTDIPAADIGTFVDLAGKAKQLSMAKLNLSPPTMVPSNPDFGAAHQAVQQSIDESVQEAQAGAAGAAGTEQVNPVALSGQIPAAHVAAAQVATTWAPEVFAQSIETGNDQKDEADAICSVA